MRELRLEIIQQVIQNHTAQKSKRWPPSQGLLAHKCHVFPTIPYRQNRNSLRPSIVSQFALCPFDSCLGVLHIIETWDISGEWVNEWSHQPNQNAAHTYIHVCQIRIMEPGRHCGLNNNRMQTLPSVHKSRKSAWSLLIWAWAGPVHCGSKHWGAPKADLGGHLHQTRPGAKAAEYLNKGLIYKVSHRKVARIAVRVSHKSAQIESSFLCLSAAR